jgi:putative alpha-1,2-mannosidase
MKKTAVEYVNPLIGTNSKREFSHGNIYPEITLPFGMACWAPQTGKKLDGWIYQYEKEYIRILPDFFEAS